MTRYFRYFAGIAIGSALFCSVSTAQSSSTSASSQSSSGDPAAAGGQQQVAPSAQPADAKKTKKVWTNEDVKGITDPVSVVGDAKNAPKGGSQGKADPQYIANVRKQLEKLQSQLNDTETQIADLKDFMSGKAPTTSSGYELSKGYNRVPVDQQLSSLEDKRKQLKGKIDDLLDEARKKGVEPGQLR